jgi:hypothetical protein
MTKTPEVSSFHEPRLRSVIFAEDLISIAIDGVQKNRH